MYPCSVIVNLKYPVRLTDDCWEESVFCEAGYLEKVGAAYGLASDRERLFADLAVRAWSEDRSAKLYLLQRLEIESLTLLASILEGSDHTHLFTRPPSPSVRTRARALADRRWIEAIEALSQDMPRRVAQIEQLERLAPIADVGRLARVTAHHVALQMFMHLELLGRGRESILPALALIPADLPLAAAAG